MNSLTNLYFLQALSNLSAVTVIFITTAVLLFIACGYYLYCVPQQKIADKLGYKHGWMAYIPVARNIQRMKMIGMSLWKFFFVGSIFFTYAVVCIVIDLIGDMFVAFNLVLVSLIVRYALLLSYMVLSIIFSFEYYSKLAKRFGFSMIPTAILCIFSTICGWTVVLSPVALLKNGFLLLIACSDRYDGKPLSEKPAVAAVPAPVAPVAPAGKIGIEGLSGMYSGVVFEMNSSDVFTIGRDGTLSNIIISANGEKVSRRHCSVRYLPTNNTYEVTDYSSNGTFYGNTRLVKGQPISVPRGTVLVVGDKMNQFKLL